MDWTGVYSALKKSKYDGWLTIEAFGRALPELAAATRVWRDFSPSLANRCISKRKFKNIERGWAKT